MSLYIGPDKIKDKKEEGDYVTVSFNTRKDMVLKKKTYDNLISFEAIHDLTKLQDRKILPVMQDLVKLFLEYDLTLGDIEALFAMTTNFLNDKLNYASASLWVDNIKNKLPDNYIPSDVFSNRTIGEIDQILNNANKNRGKDNTAKTK